MNWLSNLFARRYLFSRKSHSVINIISIVSAVAVGVPVAAMVILLSVFNGFEQLVKGLYKEFDPDIIVKPSTGKVFVRDSLPLSFVLGVNGVAQASYVLEDNALVEYAGRQFIVDVRGVDSLYGEVIPIENMVVSGEWRPMHGELEQALVGRGVASNLGLRESILYPINIFAPKRGSFSSLLPIDSYNERSLFASGIFALDIDTDGSYIIVPISFTESLYEYPGMATAMMIKAQAGASPDRLKKELSRTLGQHYTVLTRYEQKATLYKLMKFEKWGIFFIILMVLVIASFSMIGSLVMLIIDKRPGIRTITTMGGSIGFVRSIFIRQGMMISTSGAIGGLILGLGICWAQMRFGLLKMPAATFLVDSYPVVVRFADIAAVVLVFTVVNYFIAKFTVSKMIPRSGLRL